MGKCICSLDVSLIVAPCRWRPLREIIALLLQKVLGVVAVLFSQTVYQLDYARSYRTYEDA